MSTVLVVVAVWIGAAIVVGIAWSRFMGGVRARLRTQQRHEEAA